jgi:DNA-directed RNA polymerase specialized sigma24 family protein
MKNREAAQREYDLVQRALTGDEYAWYLLFHDQQPRLIAKVRQLLGPRHRHDDLAEEVAARVWSAVLADDFRLLRAYDPQRGRLGTFLGRRVSLEMLVVLRARAIRFRHESRYRSCHTEEVTLPPLPEELVWQEILMQLTERERSYLQRHLLHNSTAPLPPIPVDYLRKRVRLKILTYLEGT